MMDAYGRAVVEERTKPRHLAELAAYLRHEYGPATGPGFVFAQMADGARRAPRKGPEAANGVLRTLAKAVKALVPGKGNGRKAKALNPTR